MEITSRRSSLVISCRSCWPSRTAGADVATASSAHGTAGGEVLGDSPGDLSKLGDRRRLGRMRLGSGGRHTLELRDVLLDSHETPYPRNALAQAGKKRTSERRDKVPQSQAKCSMTSQKAPSCCHVFVGKFSPLFQNVYRFPQKVFPGDCCNKLETGTKGLTFRPWSKHLDMDLLGSTSWRKQRNRLHQFESRRLFHM